MKKYLTLLFLAFGLMSYSQVKEAPTIHNCGCVVKDAFKVTQNTTEPKKGTVTIYANEITFTFGSTFYSFIVDKNSPDYLYDTVKGGYLKIEKQNDLKYIKYNKSILYYKL